MDQAAEIVDLENLPMEAELAKVAAEKGVDYFSQYGPWAVLFAALLAVFLFFGWKLYTRMANALDSQHAKTVEMAQQHTREMAVQHAQILQMAKDHTQEVSAIGDKYQKSMTEITDKHGSVCNDLVGEIRAGREEIRQVRDRLENLEAKIQ